MKNIKLTSLLILFITAFTFSSCENEAIDSALELNPTNPTNPVNSNCAQPTSFQASNFIQGTDINLSWVAGDDEVKWEIQYGTQGFTLGTGTFVSSTNTNLTISALNSTNSYQFYVRSVCDVNNNSSWVGPVLVQSIIQNPNCTSPTNLTANRVTGDNTKVNVIWNAGGTETSWQVQYGNAGFSIGSGVISTSTSVNKQITGLQANQSYDFYVRANCSLTTNSTWVGPFNVNAVTVTNPTIVGYMNAKVNGVQHNQMKPAFYTFAGLSVGVDINSNISDDFKLLKIQGNSDPFFTTNSGTEINLYISEQYWHTGTYVLNSAFDFTSDASGYPYVDLIIQESGQVVYENEVAGTITILEFNSTTKRIKGTFSFTYMNSTNSIITGPFNVTNGEFEFTLEDEVFN